MRKKVIGIAAVTAMMSLATGMTAFAGQWVTDHTGYGEQQKYVNDDGSIPAAGWFTDPETQLVYHLDPDGYRMTDTRVEGYYLDADGVRQEKTEEEILREAKEAARKEGVRNPGKGAAEEKVAAGEAKDRAAADGTTRRIYISELKVINNQISQNVSLARADKTIELPGSENNLEAVRSFSGGESGTFYTFTVYKTKEASENAASLTYTYDAAPEADRELYNDAYAKTVISMLGENEGKAVVDYVQSQREQGVTKLSRDGKTDAGNSYTVKYNNNRIEIAVVCSEVKAEDNTTTEENTEAADTTESTETASETVTAKTITVGAGAAKEETAEDTTENTDAQ